MTERFSDPTESADGWADVRMTDPHVGEWEVDAVVLEGHVEYVDLRVQPDLLAGFFACLLEDIDESEAAAALARAAQRRGVDPETVDPESVDDEVADESE